MKALLALALLSGCGALFNEPTTEVTVSNPKGYALTVDGLAVQGNVLRLDNRKDHLIVATDKDGRQVGSCQVLTHIQGRYIVGDVLLGLVPAGIDAITGDWSQIEDNRCSL